MIQNRHRKPDEKPCRQTYLWRDIPLQTSIGIRLTEVVKDICPSLLTKPENAEDAIDDLLEDIPAKPAEVAFPQAKTAIPQRYFTEFPDFNANDSTNHMRQLQDLARIEKEACRKSEGRKRRKKALSDIETAVSAYRIKSSTSEQTLSAPVPLQPKFFRGTTAPNPEDPRTNPLLVRLERSASTPKIPIDHFASRKHSPTLTAAQNQKTTTSLTTQHTITSPIANALQKTGQCTLAEALQTVEAIKLCLRQLLVCATFITQAASQTPELAKRMKEMIDITKRLQEEGKYLKSINSRSSAHNALQEKTVAEIVEIVPLVIKFVSCGQKAGTTEETKLPATFNGLISCIKKLSVTAKSLTFNTDSRETFSLYS